MCRGVESIAGVVTRMIQLGLAHLEDVHLDRAVGRRQEHSRRLDGLSPIGTTEDFQLRDVTEQSVDDVEVGGDPVGIRQSDQDRQSAHDDRWSAGQRTDLVDALDHRRHCMADERDPPTRHGPTGQAVSMRPGSPGRVPHPARDPRQQKVDERAATRRRVRV